MFKDFVKKANELGASIDFFVSPDETKKDSVWYGGEVCSIKYKNFELILLAEGDVVATLFDDESEEVCSVKDKMNSGLFSTRMTPFIESDAKMLKLEEAGNLVFMNNNWFEVAIYKDKENEPFMRKVCDGSYIDTAIDEVIANIKNNMYDLEEEM